MFVRLWSFALLTRPVFLLGGALLYALGAAIATSAGDPIDWRRYLLGQAIVTCVQLTAHYANEYFDCEADRLIGANRTWFTGGSGVLPRGLLPPSAALGAARVCAMIAIVAIVVAAPIEPAMSVIGALALLGGWFYSAPPVRLVASGFGELTTALIVAFLAPLSGLVMQRGPVDVRLVAITLPLVLMQMAMLVVVELPDLDADARAGKRTLAVRTGRARAALLHSVLLIAAFAATWIAAAIGWIHPRIPLWTLLVAPLAAWQFAGVLRHSYRGWRAHGVLAAGGVGLFAATAAATFAGLVIG